jgi:hypothetical protein
MRLRLRASAPGFAAPVAGFVLGVVLVWTYPGRAASLWLLWAPLALALSTASGALFVYGLRRWVDLNALHPVRVSDVAAPVVAAETVGVLGINVPFFLPGAAHANWRNSVLLTFALLAGFPAGGVMYGIRQVATSTPLCRTAGGKLALLVGLRRLLQRLLAAVGSLVALVTLQASALLALERSLNTSFGHRPPQFVLIFGAVGSLLVAQAYVPGWTALQREGHRLCDELFPMGSLDEASAILSTAEGRQKLEQVLGVDRSMLTDMQTGLIILAPLLASTAAALLPH